MNKNDSIDGKRMPEYQCHKRVHALKIKDMSFIVDSSGDIDNYVLVPEEPGYEPFNISIAYMKKHDPEVGGYYVVYGDGYQSYSPAKAFEEGYTRLGLVEVAGDSVEFLVRNALNLLLDGDTEKAAKIITDAMRMV